MYQNSATDAFISHHSAAMHLMARIQAHLDDHCGLAPDDISWGNAGEIAAIKRALAMICEQHGIPEMVGE